MPCRAPSGGGRRKVQEAVSGRGCRAAFPGASQRGRLPAPSAQAILGKGRRGFDWPWVSGTGPPPAVELGPLLTSEHGFFFISICFPCDGSPSQGGLGEISLTGRNPSQRGCKTDGRAHGSVGRDGSREKGGGTGLHPSFQAPTDLFPLPREKFRRHRRRQRTRLEARSGDEMTPFQTHPILSMDSYIQQPGSRPSREEPIQRSSRLGPQFHFAGKPHTGHNCSFLTGGSGEQPSRTRTKNKLTQSRRPVDHFARKRSRPGPDRPGYRGTAPPFRRTPPPIRTTDRRCQTQRGESVSGQDLPLAALAGWLDRSLEEREKKKAVNSTHRLGWRLRSCSTGKHRLVSDHPAATTQEPRTRQSGDGEGDGMNLSDEALV